MIKASVLRLIEFLESYDRQYVIPSFQRGYIWDENHWEALWNNLLEISTKETHREYFYGTIITNPIDINFIVVDLRKLLILDGQQRLVTVCLLLTAIRDTLVSDNHFMVEKINRLLFVDNLLPLGIKVPAPKFVLNSQDQDSFIEVLNGRVSSKSRITCAYEFFVEKLTPTPSESSTQILLFETLLKNFIFIHIEVPPGEDPFPIFAGMHFDSNVKVTKPIKKPDVFQNISYDEAQFLRDQLHNFRRFSQDPELVSLIFGGESEQTEFKEAVLLNPYSGKVDLKIREPVIKAIAAFMNSKLGGTLLIGVADNGSITGIEREYSAANEHKANWDGYILFLADLINTNLSIQNPFHFYMIERRVIDRRSICVIRVKPANSPVYFNKRLYVRSGSQSLERQGPDLVDYVKIRWGSSET